MNHPAKIWCRDSLGQDSCQICFKTALGNHVVLKMSWSLNLRALNSLLLMSWSKGPWFLYFPIAYTRKGRWDNEHPRCILSDLLLAGNFFFSNKACRCCILLKDILIFNKNTVLTDLSARKVIAPWSCTSMKSWIPIWQAYEMGKWQEKHYSSTKKSNLSSPGP